MIYGYGYSVGSVYFMQELVKQGKITQKEYGEWVARSKRVAQMEDKFIIDMLSGGTVGGYTIHREKKKVEKEKVVFT